MAVSTEPHIPNVLDDRLRTSSAREPRDQSRQVPQSDVQCQGQASGERLHFPDAVLGEPVPLIPKMAATVQRRFLPDPHNVVTKHAAVEPKETTPDDMEGELRRGVGRSSTYRTKTQEIKHKQVNLHAQYFHISQRTEV